MAKKTEPENPVASQLATTNDQLVELQQKWTMLMQKRVDILQGYVTRLDDRLSALADSVTRLEDVAGKDRT